MPWNHMQVRLSPEDLTAYPLIGPGGLTRAEALAEVQGILDREPILAEAAAIWRPGAADDTVCAGPFVWTVYEHPANEDPRRAALAWLDDFAATMRAAGLDVGVAAWPESS